MIAIINSESESEVTQSCPTLCDPVDCSLPNSSVHGIFQAIVLEWITISFSRDIGRVKFFNIHWIIEKARVFQKNIYFCFIDYAKAFDCVDHNKLKNS